MGHQVSGYIAWPSMDRSPIVNIICHVGGLFFFLLIIILCLWALRATATESYQSDDLLVAGMWGFLSLLCCVYVFVFVRLFKAILQGLFQLTRDRAVSSPSES